MEKIDAPPGWQLFGFSEILDFKGGTQPPKEEFVDIWQEGYVRLVQIRDFSSDQKAVFIKDSHKWQKCCEDDIMIGRYGASVGKILRGKSGAYNVALVKMLIPHEKFDRNFIYYWLQTSGFQNPLKTVSRSAQNGFNKDDLREIIVPVPPVPEQRRIVARIEALFARTRRARADLERVAPLARHHRDRVLAQLFSQDWPEATVAGLSKTTFDGPFGSNLKSADYSLNGVRVVRLENIGHLHFIREKKTFISDEKAAKLGRHNLLAGDVLFSSFIDKEVRVCLMPDDLPTAAINKADCFCVRVDGERCNPEFLAMRLASPQTYEDMREAVHGATRPRIGLTDLKGYRVPAPELETQKNVVSKIKSAHRAIAMVEGHATRALALVDRLEQSILTRAFRGELVPQDPNDEPAELLLTRTNTEVDPPTSPTPRRRGRPPGKRA